jgi:hypothetical protein
MTPTEQRRVHAIHTIFGDDRLPEVPPTRCDTGNKER